MTGGKTQHANGTEPLQRAEEAEDLLSAVQQLVTSFIRAADEESSPQQPHSLTNCTKNESKTTLIEPHPPKDLQRLLNFPLPEHGLGRDAFIQMAEKVLHYSVNTWSQSFLDKLYASTTPVGLASDLLLSALNTNVHVYAVSPALTIIERTVTRALANMFGFTGPNAGGVSQPGGSAANQMSMVVARNWLFPETKTEGNGGRRFVVLTSEHGHYSAEKAAQICGFGTGGVRKVAVDERGRMRVDALEEAIRAAREKGETPFYVNATAGTTVLGSFDPIEGIADVCEKHGLWLHVDGSWGGSIIFSQQQKYKLKGIERADSITLCAHKMLNVPLTCSFLLGKDLRQFHHGMTLPAGYLFHNDTDNDTKDPDSETEFWDLADLTPQCGRRGDSLKLALTWLYHGTNGLAASIDHAFSITSHLTSLIKSNPRFTLVSEDPPPCLQVCFYFDKKEGDVEGNGRRTEGIVRALLEEGIMTDFAPGVEGRFLRVVVNGQTRRETVEGLVGAVEEVGEGL